MLVAMAFVEAKNSFDVHSNSIFVAGLAKKNRLTVESLCEFVIFARLEEPEKLILIRFA
jgi:hypothetical protein